MEVEVKKENDLKHTQNLITIREKSARKIRKLKKQIVELQSDTDSSMDKEN